MTYKTTEAQVASPNLHAYLRQLPIVSLRFIHALTASYFVNFCCEMHNCPTSLQSKY